MKLLHTADWHLGHTLHGHTREHEHDAFLKWLLDVVDREKIDVLLIAGDIFDSANPPASAQNRYFRFLADLHATRDVEVVITAGNHDSPARLTASKPLLRSFGIHVVGTPEKMVLRLNCGIGCAAVPFLRPSDLPNVDAPDPLIAGVKQVYEEVTRELEGCSPLVLMGHLYMTGTALSALSERKVLGGNQHALPLDTFPEADYVALGHLHRPQEVGSLPHIRYSGSPVPLAMDEGCYPHQVVVVSWENGEREIKPVEVPRTTEMVQLPEATLDEVIEQLREYPFSGNPYLEVRVRLDKPEPHLRTHILHALEGKEVRLCKITPRYTGRDDLAREKVERAQLNPDEIFRRRYQLFHEGEPPGELIDGYHLLLERAYAEVDA